MLVGIKPCESAFAVGICAPGINPIEAVATPDVMTELATLWLAAASVESPLSKLDGVDDPEVMLREDPDCEDASLSVEPNTVDAVMSDELNEAPKEELRDEGEGEAGVVVEPRCDSGGPEKDLENGLLKEFAVFMKPLFCGADEVG